MDPYSSSGEILNIKTRKPYTITKQRERWTEEEHNSFLEALKLYGRAWQRIEEHIGTKTAVQIRSHAQKFFTKLEKEAVAKGVPTRQALDMEIPPPRPKRKPNYPYPRKSHQPSLKPIPDTQTTTNEHGGEEKQENATTNEEMEKKEMSCASLSSENENNSRELIDETNKSYMTTDQSQNPRGGNYPRHVHVQVVDGSQGVITGEEESTVNIASCSSYPTPAFPFTTPFSDNQFLHVSSTISSLIVSSLLQNPAAHAAATFAAKFWHHHSSSSSSTRDHDSPSMAAIAAATVAAATAWWAAHGLVPHPVCPPPPPFSFPVAAATSEMEKPPENLNTIITKETPPVVGVGVGVGVGKQVDRSSCGSNTTSSSEIETDALEKNVKEKEEIKGGGSDVANDSVSRSRVRNTTVNPNESWKEVSEEGRLAFQALFSRQVLPQSFSDRHNNNNNNNMNNDGLMNHQLLRGEERLLTIGLGHTHTGFKPYKRCSMEAAKEKTKIQIVGPSDDKGAKRMRFEADK